MRDTPVILDRVPLRIDPAEVRAFQEYKGALSPGMRDLEMRLSAITGETAAAIRPRLVYRRMAVVQADRAGLRLAGGAALHIPDIGTTWGAVEAVFVCLATIGDAAEARALARHEAGDLVEATLLDSAASAAVECLAEWGNDHLCQLGVAAGQRVTNRISPGLAGWDLGEQATLLAVLPVAALGVRLTAAGSMKPAKSISFLVGIGATARVDHYFPQCRRCWAATCPARRHPTVGSVNLRRDSDL